MKIEVGTRVKITGGYGGEFEGREGMVTRLAPIGAAMVTSKEGLRDHYYNGGEDFHLMFEGSEIEPIQDTLTIEPGKYYRTRDGRKVGPAKYISSEGGYPWNIPNEEGGFHAYKSNGKSCVSGNSDLIYEWAEDGALNAICDERKDGPFVRDPELTSPYGDGNHPLPPMTPETGTLAELNVQPGDVVEMLSDGTTNTVNKANVLGENSAFAGQVDADLSEYGQGIFDQEQFRIISRASDTPKTWGEMSDAEKGELLLAWQRGGQLQYWDEDNGRWESTDIEPFEFEADAYRIKPEPKRETVRLYGVNGYGGEIEFDSGRDFGDWRITFDTIDGKPDLDSIKMEEV